MAMVRLPTRASHGKANLHQGAVGAGIDIATGVTLDGVVGTEVVTHHPDTTHADRRSADSRTGTRSWTSRRAATSSPGLGYIGVDIVLDRDLGPLVLELNARPGLAIQIANRQGLLRRLRVLRGARGFQRSCRSNASIFAKEVFAHPVRRRWTVRDMSDRGGLARRPF